MKSMEIGSNTSLKSNALLKLTLKKKPSDFGCIMGMKIDPKWKKKLMEKWNDFEAKVQAS